MLKRILPRHLFGRSLIIIVAPIVLLQAIVAYVFFERDLDTTTRRLARDVAADMALLVSIEDNGGPDRLKLRALSARQQRTRTSQKDGGSEQDADEQAPRTYPRGLTQRFVAVRRVWLRDLMAELHATKRVPEPLLDLPTEGGDSEEVMVPRRKLERAMRRLPPHVAARLQRMAQVGSRRACMRGHTRGAP